MVRGNPVDGCPTCRRKSPTQRIVDHLLERSTLLMDGIVEQSCDVGVERQCGPHRDIMMPSNRDVKMQLAEPPTQPQGSWRRPKLGQDMVCSR